MNSYNKVMMHDREIISDAKKQIHRVDQAKKYGKSAAKMKGSPSYMSDSQEKTDLTTDMPVDSRASAGSALPMKGSFMSKFCRK